MYPLVSLRAGKYDAFCIENEGFAFKTRNSAIKMMDSALNVMNPV